MRNFIKKIKKVISYEAVKPSVRRLLDCEGDVKLNIGCGTDCKDGWINIDNNSDENIEKLDLNWDLRYLLPFPENSVGYIFNEHFIERVTVEEGQVAIRDLMRVLKPGGVMRIATPDLEFIKTRAERINVGFRYWGHKWIYDWEELERLLREAGCVKVKRMKLGESKYTSLRNLETRPKLTLIAEVTK